MYLEIVTWAKQTRSLSTCPVLKHDRLSLHVCAAVCTWRSGLTYGHINQTNFKVLEISSSCTCVHLRDEDKTSVTNTGRSWTSRLLTSQYVDRWQEEVCSVFSVSSSSDVNWHAVSSIMKTTSHHIFNNSSVMVLFNYPRCRVTVDHRKSTNWK